MEIPSNNLLGIIEHENNQTGSHHPSDQVWNE